jgi:tetratricopeptide (TPR) repeat protein
LPGSWLAAAIFAVHPVQVESVAWITERKNVLSGVMYFAAGLAYLRFIEIPIREARRRSFYAVALACFAAALLSKTVTCSLPAALLLVMWWKRGRVSWRDVIYLAPMLALGAAAAVVTSALETHHVGAAGREWDYTAAQRVIIAGRALWFYAAKLIVPIKLAFVYPQWAQWKIDARNAWNWGPVVAAVIVIALLIALRRRMGRGPLVAVLFFAGTLLPALGFVNIYPMRYTFVADHYQYLACIGLIALVVAGLVRMWPRGQAVLSLVLAPLMVLSIVRCRVFQNPIALWRDTAAKNPNAWMVHMNLGSALAEAYGKTNEAEEHFAKAAELAPTLPETHWNLGVNLASHRDYAGAMKEYDRALALDPKYPGALLGKANVYRAMGKRDEAKAEYRKAIDAFGQYASAHRNLGDLLEEEGDLDGAIKEYAAAVTSEPLSAKGHNVLGKALVKKGKLPEALGEFRSAVEAEPNFAEAHLNLGSVLAAMGDASVARKEVEEAVRLDPGLSKYAWKALGQGR